MPSLKTDYLGLTLKNPIVVGACDLLEDENNLLKIQDAGAGAIVFKSLFEEQIQLEDLDLHHHLYDYDNRNAEMTRLFPEMDFTGPREFMLRLKKIREIVKIPLIGSLNAVFHDTWVKYAKEMQEVGVDALELNFFNVPFSNEKSAAEIEDEQIAAVKAIVEEVKVPVSVKLSPYYTNILNFTKKLDETGISGLVLFNKLYQPDIDVLEEKHSTPWNLSSEKEYKLALRFAGLLHGELNAQIIGNRGIFTADDAIKMIMAGAQAVQVVSTLYKNGVDQITRMLDDINKWMEEHNYDSLDDFRGKLNRANTLNPFVYKRAQYIEMLLNSSEVIGRPVL